MTQRLLILLFTFCYGSIIAQEKVSSPLDAIELARELTIVKQYDSAVFYFQKSIQLSIEQSDNWSKTLAQSELGRNYIHLREFEKARELSESILNDQASAIRSQIIAHQNLGRLYARNPQDYDKEMYHNHMALKIALKEIPQRFSNKTKNDSLKTSNIIRAYQVLSYMHRDLRSYDSAHYYMDRLMDLLKKKQPDNTYELAYNKLGLLWLYVNQNRFSDIKIEIDRTQPLIDILSLKTQRDFDLAAKYYNLLDVYHSRMRRNDLSLAARVKQEQIMSVSPRIDSTLFAQLQTNMGIGYYIAGDINKAFEYEKNALKLKERILPKDDLGLAASYKMLGIYRINQSFAGEEATEYFREALRINQKQLGKLDRETVDAMHNLSLGLNTAGQYAESLEVEREALRIYVEIGTDDYFEGSLYAGIATNQISLDSLSEAITVYQELIKFSNNSKVNMSLMKIKGESGLGFAYLRLNEYEDALEHFKAAERMLVEKDGPKNSGLAAIYNGIAKSLKEQSHLDEALEMIKKAIEVNSYEKILFNIDPVPPNLLAKKQIQFIDSFVLYTQILLDKTSKQTFPNFNEFWSVFDKSVEIIESSISEQTNSVDVISLLSANKTLYSAGIDARWLMDSLGIASQDSQSMWQLSEKSKAVNQKLNDRKRQAINPIASETKINGEFTAINNKIAYYKTLTLKGFSHDSVSAGLFKALQAKKDFNDQLKLDFPLEYSLNYLSGDVSYDDVKRSLGTNQTIVDYFATPENLYAFVINQNGVDSFKLNWTEELQEQVIEFKSGLINGSNHHKEMSSNIYKQIFRPLETSITGDNVIIIPDKHLWNINFDLLNTANEGNSNVGESYLIEKYAISYSYSTSMLITSDKQSNSRRQVLAFSYAEGTATELQLDNMRDGAKENLPGTAEEIRSLETSLNGSFYYGDQANEHKFKQIASDYSILHLALHGEVDNQDPDNSKLFFNGKGQGDEDNKLHTFELYNMDLNSDLAVLSACNTGTGKINDGEGIMSLGKAFQYAGVNSVLLSQWEVSDAVAPVIISSFYKYLKEGQNKAEALRSAKLDFLRTSNNITSNPYYWGSFFIIGNPESINFETNRQRWFWLLGISVILIIIFARRRKKSRSLAA